MRSHTLQHHLRALAIVVVLGSSHLAFAGTIYEVTTAGATQDGSKNNQGVYIGQSFNAGTNTRLTTATLEINREGLATGDFTLNLHLTTGSAGNYFKTGSTLASVTLSNTVLSGTTQSFFTFPTLNWALTPNTVYMIGIASESTATVKWSLNQSATQDESTGFITGFTGYNSQEGTNKDNGLHGATISAVPEPTTAALLVTAGVVPWLVRRRRRQRPVALACRAA